MKTAILIFGGVCLYLWIAHIIGRFLSDDWYPGTEGLDWDEE